MAVDAGTNFLSQDMNRIYRMMIVEPEWPGRYWDFIECYTYLLVGRMKPIYICLHPLADTLRKRPCKPRNTTDSHLFPSFRVRGSLADKQAGRRHFNRLKRLCSRFLRSSLRSSFIVPWRGPTKALSITSCCFVQHQFPWEFFSRRIYVYALASIASDWNRAWKDDVCVHIKVKIFSHQSVGFCQFICSLFCNCFNRSRKCMHSWKCNSAANR